MGSELYQALTTRSASGYWETSECMPVYAFDDHRPFASLLIPTINSLPRTHVTTPRSVRSTKNVKYSSAWWLPGPHLATLWGKLGRRERAQNVRWEQVETPDGDFVELAHADVDGSLNVQVCIGAQHINSTHNGDTHTSNTHTTHTHTTHTHTSDTYNNTNRPRLLLLHGLEGGVNSHYVRGFMREANDRGWNATLLLFRTCGPTPNKLPRSYHSGETTDLQFVIEHLARQNPDAPIGVAAVSLGANVLCKYLGEQGESAPNELTGAVAISAPFDLARASRHIGRGFGKVYERAFLRSLIPKALEKIARHQELTDHVQSARVKHAQTLWDFDDVFTSPLHGFLDAADYYARSSSLQYLSRIRRPTLLLSSVDDPFLPSAVLDEVRVIAAHNPALEIEFPARGGHVGFTAGSWPWTPFYYAEWRAAEFLAEQFAKRDVVERANIDAAERTERLTESVATTASNASRADSTFSDSTSSAATSSDSTSRDSTMAEATS